MLKFKEFVAEIRKQPSEQDETSSIRRAISDLKQKMNDPGYSDVERKQYKDWHDKEVKRLKLYGVNLEAEEEPLKKSCWKGYTAIDTKEKNGKTVPNCVPEEFHESEFPKNVFLKDYLKPKMYDDAGQHAKDADKHKKDYISKAENPKFGPNHENTIKSKALWKWHTAQKHFHEGKPNSQSWYSSNMDEFDKLKRAHALLANKR